MKISVVIPAYNEESFLTRTLQSLNNQNFKFPYEIIVVDNNSTDKTSEIAKKFGAKVVFEKKQGYAHACNTGFNEATGEIIARADADYFLPKDWLKKIWNEFEKDKKLVALGGPTYPLESHWWENMLYFPAHITWMYLLKLLQRGFLFPNMAVRRDIYKKCGGFDTKIKFGEDTDISKRLKKLGKVKLIPNIYVYTSIRRLRALGLLNFIIKYGLGGELAKITGKPPEEALEIVRDIPNQPPKPSIPWPYLIGGPTVLFIILTIIAISYWLGTQNPSYSLLQVANDKFQNVRSDLLKPTKKIIPQP